MFLLTHLFKKLSFLLPPMQINILVYEAKFLELNRAELFKFPFTFFSFVELSFSFLLLDQIYMSLNPTLQGLRENLKFTQERKDVWHWYLNRVLLNVS